MPTRSDARPRNRLLAALGAEELARLEPCLERTELPRGHLLYPAGEPIQQICFPETAVVSLRVTLASGAAAEVGTVGREGFIGHAVLLGDTASSMESLVQVPGAVAR